MISRSLLLVSAAMLAASVLPAAAWTPPAVGQACSGTRGPGPRMIAIAGNYMGGRLIRDGIVDRKSFQACFQNADRCELWLADKARQFPLRPGIATCSQVVLR
jgi:hypothetical protein